MGTDDLKNQVLDDVIGREELKDAPEEPQKNILEDEPKPLAAVYSATITIRGDVKPLTIEAVQGAIEITLEMEPGMIDAEVHVRATRTDI